MDKDTIKIILVSLILLVFVLVLAFLVSRLVKKAIEKRRLLAEERIKKMSETEEGREVLDEENQEASEKQTKALEIAAVVYLVVYGLFIITGIASIIIFVLKVKAGKKVLEIIGSDRGFFVLAPVAMLWAVYSLLKLAFKRRER
ncbi:MAG: hypothetical protein J6Y69_01590 [Treponema sp.]|nr:hypothetical protein [Treponema sp.]